MVYCVGLTGNIASGKTTVAKLFSDLGVEVINADLISRELSAPNEPVYKKILEHFGSNLVLENKELDRRALRAVVFSDRNARIWLENLLHPLIRSRLEERVSQCKSTYCIVEIPLLTDKKHYPYLNKILLVTAPEAIQIERVIARDNCTKEQATAVLAAQPDMKQRLKNADDVIINDMGLTKLKNVVSDLHYKYLNHAI